MNTEIMYRPAMLGDIDQMSALHEFARYAYSYLFSPTYLTRILKDTDWGTLVAVQSVEQIIGMATFTFPTSQRPEINCLVTNGTTGVGRVLLRRVEDILIQRGYDSVTLESNNPHYQPQLDKWYTQQGYMHDPMSKFLLERQKNLLVHPERLIHLTTEH